MSTEPARLAASSALQALAAEQLLLAYHDRSDGGLFAVAAEMAFRLALRCLAGPDGLCFDR